MQHKHGISYYMQIFRFFAIAALTVLLAVAQWSGAAIKTATMTAPTAVASATQRSGATAGTATASEAPTARQTSMLASSAIVPSAVFDSPAAAIRYLPAAIRYLPAAAIRSLPAAIHSLPATRADPNGITQVIVGGDAIAVRLASDGVIVLGFSDEDSQNPARKAGLKKGDRIVAIGDTRIDCNDALAQALQRSDGTPLSLHYVRGSKEAQTTVCPRKSDDGTLQIGVLIKDSTAGIGTLTFVIPDSGEYGCLGHGISDPDTDTLFCVGKGDLYPAEITSLRKGVCGAPGELQGMFSAPILGRCTTNGETGLFGQLDVTRFRDRVTVPVASKSEVREGNATIRCTVDGEGIREYSIEIVRIYRAFGGPTKNMLIRVTDPTLLEQTGGIVQGMSGSPILQNGKLVGAVTHVLINDPTSGYGIFIENMLSSIPESEAQKKAS